MIVPTPPVGHNLVYMVRTWNAEGEPFWYRFESFRDAQAKSEEFAKTSGMAELFQLIGTCKGTKNTVWE